MSSVPHFDHLINSSLKCYIHLHERQCFLFLVSAAPLAVESGVNLVFFSTFQSLQLHFIHVHTCSWAGSGHCSQPTCLHTWGPSGTPSWGLANLILCCSGHPTCAVRQADDKTYCLDRVLSPEFVNSSYNSTVVELYELFYSLYEY